MNHLYSINFLLRWNNVCRIPINLKTLIIPFSTNFTKTPSPHNPLVADYFMKSFGLSREQAISASTSFSPKKTTDCLSPVFNFLKQSGFSDTHIRNLICMNPEILSLNLEKSLKPKIVFLQGLGFFGSTLADFILGSPSILKHGLDLHYNANINFLRSFLNSNENIVDALKKSKWLLSYNLQKLILPNIEILKRYGVAEERITSYLLKQPRVFSGLKPDKLEERIAWTENMGLKRESKLFMYGLQSIISLDRSALDAKIEMYKSFGWSESDFISAFKKFPLFLGYSESRVRAMMSFFSNEVGYEPKEIALRPSLLTYSLEKRLVPWNKVLKILNLRGLMKTKKHQLATAVSLSNKKFLETYVLPYAEIAPELEQAYLSSAVNVKMRRTKR